uniref:Uncharacterized protein n=1 Tax=Anguilla anguilla TaxID=7936 RepID=A0A0E9RAG7_ANGAN
MARSRTQTVTCYSIYNTVYTNTCRSRT